MAFPTETVYGLGANGLDEKACKRIYEAKGRPSDNPLILTIGDLDGLYKIVGKVTENAKKIIDAFWPGPITLVLPKADCVPETVTGGLDTVAVRYRPINCKGVNKNCRYTGCGTQCKLIGKTQPYKSFSCRV